MDVSFAGSCDELTVMRGLVGEMNESRKADVIKVMFVA